MISAISRANIRHIEKFNCLTNNGSAGLCVCERQFIAYSLYQNENILGLSIAGIHLMRWFLALFIISIHLFAPQSIAAAAKKQCKIIITESQRKKDEHVKIQEVRDAELPDRFESHRDWGSKFLSDSDPTWRDPVYLENIREFAIPNITNYAGKARRLVSEYGEYMNHFFRGEVKNFTSNGTDANNMLFQYASYRLGQKLQKPPTAMKILTFSDLYGGSYGPILELRNQKQEHIDAPVFRSHEKLYPARLAELKKKEQAALAKIEEQIKDLNNQVGAIFIEPIPASHGVKMYRAEFLRKLRELADKYDTPIYADEIMSGGGRTGTFWAFQHYEGFVPDLVSFGKGLAVSGIFAPKRGNYSVATMGYGPPPTTMINPLALVQALQVLKTIWERRLDLNAAVTGAHIMKRTFATLKARGIHNDDRLSGIGLLITGFPTSLNNNSAAHTSGKFTPSYNSRILPILTTTKEDVDWVLDHHLGW